MTFQTLFFLSLLFVFSWYYHRNCFSHFTSLTSPHWPLGWAQKLFPVDRLFVVLAGLALLKSLVSDPAMSSGQELFPPSGNLTFMTERMIILSHRPQTCSLAFKACLCGTESVLERNCAYKQPSFFYFVFVTFLGFIYFFVCFLFVVFCYLLCCCFTCCFFIYFYFLNICTCFFIPLIS